MKIASPSLDDVDVRYRALVDVAGALTSHSDLADLLRSLRGHLEPIVQFTFLLVWLWDRESDRLTVEFFEPCDSPGGRVVGRAPTPAPGTYPGMAVQTGRPDLRCARCSADGPYPSRRADRVRRPELLRRAAHHRAWHDRNAQLRLARTPRLHARRHRADERVGALVAVALENARSVETIQEQRAALQRERDQLDLLLDVTNAIVTHLDTRALFRRWRRH